MFMLLFRGRHDIIMLDKDIRALFMTEIYDVIWWTSKVHVSKSMINIEGGKCIYIQDISPPLYKLFTHGMGHTMDLFEISNIRSQPQYMIHVNFQ